MGDEIHAEETGEETNEGETSVILLGVTLSEQGFTYNSQHRGKCKAMKNNPCVTVASDTIYETRQHLAHCCAFRRVVQPMTPHNRLVKKRQHWVIGGQYGTPDNKVTANALPANVSPVASNAMCKGY